MTSRVSPGGLAALHELRPDLKIFGKWLGGGLAFGAFGGRADVMALYDPRQEGCLPHSGTFNNNTLVLHAGYTGLSQVYTPEVCTEFNAMGTRLLKKLAEVTRGTKMCFTGIGALLASHFTEPGLQEIERAGDTPEIWALKDLFWYEMMEDGFWTVRRGNISLILGTPEEELDRFIDCVAAFLERHRDIMAAPKTMRV
jgi:glutamate-1-semialdehyde 2,1-aminomutase